MRRPFHLVVSALVLVASALCAPGAAANVLIGAPADANTGNSFPFGGYPNEYQQVYTASQFPGAITITGLDFFNTSYDSSVTNLYGSVTVSLSTTSANWNSLTNNYAANIGADNTQVFNGSIAQPWAFGDTLHIALSTPFNYDPAIGNLLLDVVSGGTYGPVFFDVNGTNGGQHNGNTIMGRVYTTFDGTATLVESGYGLVTQFDTAVPEPASFTLLGGGLLALALARRRSAFLPV